MHPIACYKSMPILGLILLLGALFLFSCMPESHDPDYVYSYAMVHIDSLGQITLSPKPDLDPHRIKFERLPDGRILAIHDSLHIYDPELGTLSDITPSPMFGYSSYLTHALSPDGQWLYYDAEGKIIRLNLQNYTTETIAASDSAKFYTPSLSQDGRYLCFLNCPTPPSMYDYLGGFVCWKDLQTGVITSLPTGNNYEDRSVKYAWMTPQGENIYYHQNEVLMIMNPDGSNRSEVLSGLILSQDSFDQRFLLCLKDNPYYIADLIYRDNNSMIWKYIGQAHRYQLCRSTHTLVYTYVDKLYRMDLETGNKVLLLADKLGKKDISGIGAIAPSWDGKDIYCLVTFVSKEEYPEDFPF